MFHSVNIPLLAPGVYTDSMGSSNKPLLRELEGRLIKRYTPGDILLYQGEVPPSALVVKSGIVRAYNISGEGDEKPVSFYGTSDILSTPWVFGKASSSLLFYEAHTDCSVIALRRDELLDIIQANHDITLSVMDRYISLLTASTLQLDALECSRASDKVLHMLFYLCQTHGISDSVGLITIDVPLTQQDLANLLGLTRETTGIELLKLKRGGLITLSKKRYIVNHDMLLRLIGEKEFESLRL